MKDSDILMLFALAIAIFVVVISLYQLGMFNKAEGIQVKKCSFWVFMCHMEEHYVENCEVGEWLRKDYETYYNSMPVGKSVIMIPYEVEYDIYNMTCTKLFDNGTEVTWESEKRM